MPSRLPLAIAVVALGLSGCATLQHDSLPGDTGGLASRAELENVPFYRQEKYQCGPAALAMVFANSGVTRSADELSGEVFIPARDGSLQIEMQAAPRRYGLLSLALKPRLKDLLTEVSAGQPVVVLQNLALDWYPKWHYAVVVGYDLERDVVILRSGTEQRQELAMRIFEHTWRRGGYWAMLVLPPDRLPQTVAADEYAAAVAQIESAGFGKQARQAYGLALQRWPQNLTAQIGLGNTSHAAGDLPAAIAAFQNAAAAHPAAAIAFNNLAQSLADAGRHAEAQAAARKAVALGGPMAEVSMRTLKSIEAIAKAGPRAGSVH